MESGPDSETTATSTSTSATADVGTNGLYTTLIDVGQRDVEG